jgi:hypothetical protein
MRALLAGAVAALLLPVSAEAALSFAFDRAQARPRQLVRAYQADSDGNPAPAWGPPEGVTIYLVRLNAPNGRRIRLGPMAVDSTGVWSITFRVPNVRRGLYTTAFLCPPCGNTFFASTLPGTRWTGRPGRVLKIRP